MIIAKTNQLVRNLDHTLRCSAEKRPKRDPPSYTAHMKICLEFIFMSNFAWETP